MTDPIRFPGLPRDDLHASQLDHPMSEDHRHDPPLALRVLRGTEDEAVAAALSRQIEYLAGEISRLEARVPTAEEAEYLRRRKLDDDRASWAWHTIKTHAPWVGSLLGAVGVLAWWVLTHTINVTAKP